MIITLINGKPMREVTTKLYKGFVEDPTIKITTIDKPSFKWTGKKIPFDLWSQVVSFLRWTQKEFKSEALVTFFYNTKTETWAAWPFPQETNGMTVKSLPEHPLYKEDRGMFRKDWVQAGSIHHHCTTKAFASGTDQHDECNRDGVHITLGKMEDTELDYHIRQCFDGIVTDSALSDWIEDPQWCETIPAPLKYDIAHWSRICIRETEFPALWKERIFKPNFSQPTTPNTQVTQTTIIGKAASTTPSGGTANGKVDRRQLGLAPRESLETRQSNWKNKQRDKLFEVCTSLGVSVMEACTLLSEHPDTTWTREDIEMRRVLQQELLKQGFPSLYLDEIIEDLK